MNPQRIIKSLWRWSFVDIWWFYSTFRIVFSGLFSIAFKQTSSKTTVRYLPSAQQHTDTIKRLAGEFNISLLSFLSTHTHWNNMCSLHLTHWWPLKSRLQPLWKGKTALTDTFQAYERCDTQKSIILKPMRILCLAQGDFSIITILVALTLDLSTEDKYPNTYL